MLGIDMNISLDIKKVTSPIYFQHRNICTRCGAEGKLVFIDRFGKESTREINAFDHIRCTNCAKIFSILWEPKENSSNKMYPSAIDTSISMDLKNMFNNKNLNNNSEKKFE